LKVGEVKNKDALKALNAEIPKYLRNMDERIRDSIKRELIEGLKEGKSFEEIKPRIVEKARGITSYQAERIARSEIIKAHSEGTKQSMVEAGIKKYGWLTARDVRVCKICREFEKKGPYEVGAGPIPVQDSHPNCRCVIIAWEGK